MLVAATPRGANGLELFVVVGGRGGGAPFFSNTLVGTSFDLSFFWRDCLFFPPGKKAPSLLGATGALGLMERGMVDEEVLVVGLGNTVILAIE